MQHIFMLIMLTLFINHLFFAAQEFNSGALENPVQEYCYQKKETEELLELSKKIYGQNDWFAASAKMQALIRSGADPQIKECFDDSVFLRACKFNDISLIETCLAYVSPIKLQEEDDQLVLSCCVSRQAMELLINAGIDANTRVRQEMALHKSIRDTRCGFEVVEFLCQYTNSIPLPLNRYQLSPLQGLF